MPLPFCPIYSLRAQNNEPARPAPPLRFVSLFAGIGGFDLGLERAGMQCVGQVEIDPYCRAVLAHHWPDVKRIDDIRKVRGDEFGAAELVCGGFPCQPFSCAGKRQGTSDDRFLWPEMFRVIAELKPTWVLGENVVNIDGLALDQVCSDLESIGFEVAPPLEIPAVAVDAHHLRFRTWFIAYSAGGGLQRRHISRSMGAVTNQTPITRRKQTAYAPGSCALGDPGCKRHGESETSLQSGRAGAIGRGWWPVEPGICRVAHGVPRRVDRIRTLGNSVVPQVVEELGRAIMKVEESLRASCPPLEEGAQRDTMEQNVNSI